MQPHFDKYILICRWKFLTVHSWCIQTDIFAFRWHYITHTQRKQPTSAIFLYTFIWKSLFRPGNKPTIVSQPKNLLLMQYCLIENLHSDFHVYKDILANCDFKIHALSMDHMHSLIFNYGYLLFALYFMTLAGWGFQWVTMGNFLKSVLIQMFLSVSVCYM